MIPETHLDLLTGPIVVSLATRMKDQSLQVQPVWCSYDGEHVLVNTLAGRQKFLNLSRRTDATVLALDPDDPNRWLEIRGRVDGWTSRGAREHVDALAQQYLGTERYVEADGDQEADRVIVRIAPVRVVAMGRPSIPEQLSNQTGRTSR